MVCISSAFRDSVMTMDDRAEPRIEQLSRDVALLTATVEQLRARLEAVEKTAGRDSGATEVAYEGRPDSIGYKHGIIGQATIGGVPSVGPARP